MGIFDFWPYTNIHEMNTDWLVRTVKHLANDWIEHNKEWQDYFTDVNEALEDMRQFIIDSFDNLQLQEYVDNWLDEHPEATTTVLDGSITENKLNMSLKKKALAGGFITPIYVGDYLCSTEYLPSSVIRVENSFYTINAPQRNKAISDRTNTGIIRKFDLQNNIEVVEDEHTADVGHGNSVAYDRNDNIIYVVPVWDTTTGREVNARYLYKFNDSMLPLGIENIPTHAMGVSFDSIHNKLYYIDYDYDIYVKEESGWRLYTNVDFTGVVENEIHSRGYIQDLAIWDNTFYISSPHKNIVFGELTEGTSEIISSYNVAYVDSANRFILGELEGMEFNNDGHLYALDYVNLTSEVSNAYVVELPVKTAIQHSTNISGGEFRLSDETLTLSEETQVKFALTTYQIRALNQLNSMIISELSSRVLIPENNHVIEPYDIAISQDILLEIAGQYTVNIFRVYDGHLNIYSNSSSNLLITTNSSRCIEVLRVGQLTISGGQRLNVSMPNAKNGNGFIYIGTYKPLTAIRLTPTSVEELTLKIGSSEAVNGLYTGSYKIAE